MNERALLDIIEEQRCEINRLRKALSDSHAADVEKDEEVVIRYYAVLNMAAVHKACLQVIFGEEKSVLVDVECIRCSVSNSSLSDSERYRVRLTDSEVIKIFNIMTKQDFKRFAVQVDLNKILTTR